MQSNTVVGWTDDETLGAEGPAAEDHIHVPQQKLVPLLNNNVPAPGSPGSEREWEMTP